MNILIRFERLFVISSIILLIINTGIFVLSMRYSESTNVLSRETRTLLTENSYLQQSLDTSMSLVETEKYARSLGLIKNGKLYTLTNLASVMAQAR